MKRAYRRSAMWVLGLFVVFGTTAIGQQVRRSEIAGAIVDETGAALPGVTVTVTSPALQVPSLVRISSERGEYLVPDLPPGTFRVTYELPGFATLAREGIILTTGFSARVDVAMKLATQAETITVSGASPLVDVTTTRGGATISKELLAAIPSNNNFRDTLLMVGGMQANNAPMVGAATAAALGFDGISYGAGQGNQMAEGMRRARFVPGNFSAYEEVDVKTFGNSADVDLPGSSVQLVVKSGGNAFHGRYADIYQHEKFQSNNIDDELRAQGITTGDTINYFNDFTADLGGRIVRDKLWFYANGRLTDNKFTATGFVSGPGADGVYQTGDEPAAHPKDNVRSGIVKISYQANPKNRFIGLYHDTNNHYNQYFSRYIPLESSARHSQLGRDVKPFEWQSVPSSRWLINAMYGVSTFFGYDIWNGPDGAVDPTGGWVTGSGAPSRLDLETLQQTGPAFEALVMGASENPKHQLRGSVSFLPSTSMLGSHTFQTGYDVWFSQTDRAYPGGVVSGCEAGGQICPANQGIGEYQLRYDRLNGLPHQASEIEIKNFPVQGTVHDNYYATYLMDTWRPAPRVTLNLGLRWERRVYWGAPTEKIASIPAGFVEPVGESFSRPRVNAGDWNVWAPRLGAAYDLTGGGRAVLKASYGWFNHELGSDFPEAYVASRPVNYRFRWRDLNRDGNYQPGETNLNLNGPDFLSVTGASNNLVNPDLRLPHTHEASASIEQQVGEGLSLRGLYVYKRIVDAFEAPNILRPYSVYDQAFSRRDPGPDGNVGTGDDGPFYTIYDYNPAYRGASFVANMNTNEPAGRHDSFNNVEVRLTKRPTGRWYANTSFLVTKAHVWRTRTVQSPNDELFPAGNYWDLAYTLAGGYTFPYGIEASTLYQLYNGLPRQRSVTFRAVDPDGGPRFPSSSTITLPMEALGDTRGPSRQIMNLRASKNFRLRASQRITASFDIFNAFNSNVPWGRIRGQGSIGNAAIADLSGPTYGNVLAIVQPRMMRFNIGYEF